MDRYEKLMQLALEEARLSLREGNSGFGAVISKGQDVITQAHDTDNTTGDPTAHAEMNVIRSGANKIGGNLAGCVMVSTHEPCPMCSTAMLWSGIAEVVYGYSTKEAIEQARKRVDIPLKEIFKRAGKNVVVHANVLHDACSVLYNRAVRQSIDSLRGADENKLKVLALDLSRKRLEWLSEYGRSFESKREDALETGYQVFLKKLGISQDQAPIFSRDENHIILHSSNFCPTLEACKILALDTRFVCRHLTEKPATDMLRRVNPKLRFTRNYEKLRPYSSYCEEMIIWEG